MQGPRKLDVERWLWPRGASEFGDEQIGLLTTPPPDLHVLGADLQRYYGWLAALDADERVVARGDAGDRALVLGMLSELHDGRLAGRLW